VLSHSLDEQQVQRLLELQELLRVILESPASISSQEMADHADGVGGVRSRLQIALILRSLNRSSGKPLGKALR